MAFYYDVLRDTVRLPVCFHSFFLFIIKLRIEWVVKLVVALFTQLVHLEEAYNRPADALDGHYLYTGEYVFIFTHTLGIRLIVINVTNKKKPPEGLLEHPQVTKEVTI